MPSGSAWSGRRGRRHHVLAHLSDLHVRGDDSRVDGVVDTRHQVERALSILSRWGDAVDAWVFSGDLSDDGSAASYAWLTERVGSAARTAGVDIIWGNGNHDDTATLRTALGLSGVGPILTEHDLAGLRILTLDTTNGDDPGGLVSPESLDWLADRLRTTSEQGTVLVLHHTPLPQPQTAADLWPLRNPGDLAAVIRNSEVRLILSGHFHQTGFGLFAGIPVAMATSLAYTQDVAACPDLRGQTMHTGFSLVELHEEGFQITAVPLDAGAGVHPVVTDGEARGRLSRAGSDDARHPSTAATMEPE